MPAHQAAVGRVVREAVLGAGDADRKPSVAGSRQALEHLPGLGRELDTAGAIEAGGDGLQRLLHGGAVGIERRHLAAPLQLLQYQPRQLQRSLPAACPVLAAGQGRLEGVTAAGEELALGLAVAGEGVERHHRRQATTMRPSRRSRSARSSARQRIAITSEAAVISKRASRSVPRGDWPPSSPRPMRTRRRLRSLRSSTRGQVTRAGSMPSALPQWRWLSSSAASRLWAAVTAWRSPLKWRLMASMGTTWAWPPPAAPTFMPKTGPSEGSRRQAMADTPSRERASTSPTQVVVLPSPTPAGEGKTTTCVGLVDALSRLGVSAMACLREPSLGPVFGMKGGAAGGGHAQVVPMEAINLHFNGDLHAVTAAHNLLAALLDNHLHWGNALGIDPARVTWPRVLDLNDRSLRRVRIGLGEEGGQ